MAEAVAHQGLELLQRLRAVIEDAMGAAAAIVAPGIGRVTWGYGPAGNPGQVRGEDIFTIENGKIASLHVFIDPPRA